MKTFEIKNILVPTDFSETGLLAIEHATFMARLFKANLYLLHVVETFEYAYSGYEPEILLRDMEDVQEAMNEKLDKLARQLAKRHGVNIVTLMANGRPAPGIAEAAKENKIDIIVMGTHGAKGFEEYFVGSNAHKVVNVAPCPVITVQTHAVNIGFTNIVVPIDNSLHSRQKVDYAVEIAKHYGAKVHILGLLDSSEKIDANKFEIKLDSVEKVVKSAELPYVRKEITGNNIAVAAMNYADEVKADLLIIMTDHESTMNGVFLGSLAKQVVNHSKVPVMSIRPSSGQYEDSGLGSMSPVA